jgi:predicted NBD/HSP70 family sugar kinase
MPVMSGNDADLGVLAEHLRGAATGVNDVGYVTGSVGIGGGFLVGGVPLRGSEGYAGEVGHLLVDSNGPPCRCGGIGCWETKVGENQLLTGAGRLQGGGPTAVAEVIDAADAGDERAAASLDAVAKWTGVGLRAVVNVFNPEVIVLGGLLARTWRARAGLVDAALNRGGLISPRDRVTLRPAALGDDSPLLGAAELAFAPLLADPLATVGSAVAQGSR